MATYSSRRLAVSTMGSRTRGDGIPAMDTVPARYRSAKLLVSESASRRFLPISRMCGTQRDPEDIDQFATAWRTIWEVAGTIIITMLWQHRVDSVFRNVNVPLQASEALIWRRVQLQLRALIKRLHCRADTAVRGAQLAACFDIFISSPRGQSGFSSRAASHRHCLDPPALLTWLTTYQKSCTNQ